MFCDTRPRVKLCKVTLTGTVKTELLVFLAKIILVSSKLVLSFPTCEKVTTHHQKKKTGRLARERLRVVFQEPAGFQFSASTARKIHYLYNTFTPFRNHAPSDTSLSDPDILLETEVYVIPFSPYSTIETAWPGLRIPHVVATEMAVCMLSPVSMTVRIFAIVSSSMTEGESGLIRFSKTIRPTKRRSCSASPLKWYH